MSRRIRGAASTRNSPAEPPSTCTLLATRTWPPGTGSTTWSKITRPSGSGLSLIQRRPGSTEVMANVPPSALCFLTQPEVPGWNSPSIWAISLLTSHSGQRATSVQIRQTVAASASNVTAHSNKNMTEPPRLSADIGTPVLTKLGYRAGWNPLP